MPRSRNALKASIEVWGRVDCSIGIGEEDLCAAMDAAVEKEEERMLDVGSVMRAKESRYGEPIREGRDKKEIGWWIGS
jgi:hypothetical protein